MQKYPNKCLVCEEEVEPTGKCKDDYLENHHPNIYGGTIDIDFGYGSKFDDMNGYQGRSIVHQAIICDDCYEKKQHLTRPIVKHHHVKWEILPKNYRNEYM